jgi:hypothetical protein
MSTNSNLLKKYQQVIVNENVTPERVAEITQNQDGKYSFDKVVIKSHYGDQALPVIEAWQQEDTLYLSVEVPEQQ